MNYKQKINEIIREIEDTDMFLFNEISVCDNRDWRRRKSYLNIERWRRCYTGAWSISLLQNKEIDLDIIYKFLQIDILILQSYNKEKIEGAYCEYVKQSYNIDLLKLRFAERFKHYRSDTRSDTGQAPGLDIRLDPRPFQTVAIDGLENIPSDTTARTIVDTTVRSYQEAIYYTTDTTIMVEGDAAMTSDLHANQDIPFDEDDDPSDDTEWDEEPADYEPE